MRPRRLLDDLGPGAAAAVATLTVLAGLRAGALLLIAEGIAGSIASLAAGTGANRGAILLAVLGVVLRAASSWGSGVVATRAAAAAKRRWRGRLVGHAADHGAGEGAERALLATRGLDDLDGYLGTVLPTAIAALVVPLALGLRILVADPLSALIIAVTIPLIPVFMILIGRHSRERAEAAAGALNRLAEHLVELAEGLPVLVGLGRAAEQTRALARIQDEHRHRLDRAVRTALLSALALELIATLSVAVVAVTLGIRLLSGGMALDTALVVLLLAPDCFTALRDVGSAYHQAQDGRVALDRVHAVLERVRTPLRRIPGPPALHDLVIAHPGRGAAGPVSAPLPLRGVVLLAGASGAGKSTVLDAVAGAVDIGARATGAVSGLAESDLAVERQAPRFAAATPRAELAGSDDPAGLLAELGLGGLADAPIGRMSPGEQRRLAVARALGRADRGAAALILDEPTAHLDAASAALVIAAVLRRSARMPVLLASHDPELQALADRVVEVTWRAADPVPVAAAPLETADGAVLPSEIVPGSRPVRRSGRVAGVGAIALGTVAAGMALALSGVSGWLIVRAASEPAIMYLLVAIVGVRFFGLGRAVARYAERIVSHRAALQAVDDVRLRLWRRLADLGAAARGAREPGTALDLLVTAPAQLRDLLPRTVVPLASGSLAAAGAAAALVVVAPGAWPVALILVVTATAAPLLAWASDRRAQRDTVARSGHLTRRIASFISAAPDLRATGSTAAPVRDLEGTAAALERAERRQGVVTASAGIVAGIGTGLAAALAPLLTSHAEIAAVLALVSLACLEPIAGAAAGAQRLPALLAVRTRLREGFRGTVAPAGAHPAPSVGELELDDVDLAWEDGRPVISQLDARLAGPGWTAVDGPSGSGKTTLVTALLGDLPPSGGAIRVDGFDLADLDRASWRSRIAWCPQEAHVFDSTLRGNLRVARPRTDPVGDDEARAVLRRVGLGHLLAGPDGLDLTVGRRGSALSGGERQRVAVARALLRGGEVLVLDEPTAHLDEDTADRMMDDLERATADRLVVLVSHRAADRERAVTRIRLGESATVPV